MRTPNEPTQRDLVIPAKRTPAPAPVETWTPISKGSVIERNQDGKIRTNIPYKP